MTFNHNVSGSIPDMLTIFILYIKGFIMKDIDIEELVNQMIISLKTQDIEFYDKPLDEKDIDSKIKRNI